MVYNSSKTAQEYHAEWVIHHRYKFSSRYLHRFDEIWQWLGAYAPCLELTALNTAWVQDYATWMLQTPNLHTGEMPHDGTIGKHMKFFRAMLKFAHLPYKWLDQTLVSAMPVVALSYPEMLAIRDAEYLTEALRQTADQFLLLAQLGLHYIDWLRLSKNDVEVMILNERPRFVILGYKQTRNLATFSVGFPELCEKIWRQYDGQFNKVPKQLFNARLKAVGHAAGLTREVALGDSLSQKAAIPSIPLWQLLTARTARHTTASVLSLARESGE